jgi:hypothetical protein
MIDWQRGVWSVKKRKYSRQTTRSPTRLVGLLAIVGLSEGVWRLEAYNRISMSHLATARALGT